MEAMKAACLIVSLLALAPVSGLADSLAVCRDSAGHELFRGFLRTEQAPESGEFHHEKELTYAFAVTADPVGIDRATFARRTGLDLENCRGPYAKIYEKVAAGRIDCASGMIRVLEAAADDDPAILRAVGVAPAEIPCSVVLPKDKIPGLPADR
jgi:hypothetical protein